MEAKDGTLLAPSNKAFEDVDIQNMDYRLGDVFLRDEMLGLHFARDRIVSTDYEIRESGDKVSKKT